MNITDFFCDQFSVVLLLFYLMLVGWLVVEETDSEFEPYSF